MGTKLLLFIVASLAAISIQASEYKCTQWTETRGVSCIFAGQSADVYERQCENPCWRNTRTRTGNWGPNCDLEKVCSLKNPKTFNSKCSKWVKQSGTTCRNPNTDRWEDKWVRTCTVGLKTSWCSDKNPNL